MTLGYDPGRARYGAPSEADNHRFGRANTAYSLLRRTAMNSRRPLADVASEILAAG